MTDRHLADIALGTSLVGYWLGLVPVILAAVASAMAIVWYGILIYKYFKTGQTQ